MKTKLLLSVAWLLVMGLASCQKDPSTSGLSNEYLVYTAHDAAADFAPLGTYYIPDSILIIGSNAVDKEGNKVAKYWKDTDALTLINTFVSQMDERGYERVLDPTIRASADVGFQLSYVEDTTYFVGYNNPYWWSYYPYYWDPGYWGSWYGWYYPYAAVYYGYTTGSLLAEMVNLRSESGSGKSLPVIWNLYVSGLLNDRQTIDITDASQAIEQGFTQSPYLNK